MTKPPVQAPANGKDPAATSSAIVVTTTTRTPQEAEYIADMLLRARLAACVQMTPAVTRYVWNGETAQHEETLLTIKTLQARYSQVQAMILKTSSYDLPEVVATPVVGCSKAYFDWIVSQVTQA